MAIPTKLTQFKDILKLLNRDTMSKTDFLKQFKIILDFLKGLKARNEQLTEALKLSAADLKEKLADDNARKITEAENKLLASSNKALKEQEDGMNFIRDKVRRIKEGKDGKDGKDADEQKIIAEVLAQIKLPEQKEVILDTPEQLADKLETLQGDDKLDISAIRDLKDKLEKLEQRPMGGRGGARKVTYIKRVNLSSQCNGVLKAFTMPKDCIEVIGVWGTSFPINFNPGTDWTFEGNTLTLTSEVLAPETGQTLYCLAECLFFG